LLVVEISATEGLMPVIIDYAVDNI
jgi:hypothetical protein